jgi:AbiTii
MRWQNDPVAKTDQPLLAQIGRDALDDGVPLTTTLRLCIALGAQARNDDLRDWASKELDGYRDGDVPEYRTIHVPLVIDGVTTTHQIRGQQISSMDLPEFARDVITEELPLAHGVGDLQALVRNAKAAGQTAVKMAHPGAAELVKLWNYEQQKSGGGTIMALYWDVNIARIEGVLDHIRTTLVRLVSEMRATMSDDATVPSPEQAASAVNVVLNAGKRIQFNINTALADNGSSAYVSTPPAAHEEGGWTKTIAIWTVIIAIIAGITLIVTLT